jgi:hypothetical protein
LYSASPAVSHGDGSAKPEAAGNIDAAQATDSETMRSFQAFSVEERMQGLYIVTEKASSRVGDKDTGEFMESESGT